MDGRTRRAHACITASGRRCQAIIIVPFVVVVVVIVVVVVAGGRMVNRKNSNPPNEDENGVLTQRRKTILIHDAIHASARLTHDRLSNQMKER